MSFVRPSDFGQGPGNTIFPPDVIARLTAPPDAPATEQRPEQIAYTLAKASGASEEQARAQAHRVYQVARNVAGGVSGVPKGLLIGLAAAAALFLVMSRRRR